MTLRRGYLPLLLCILLLAAALRLPSLADRPMHGDEAVHAVKFLDLWQHGHYVYDPQEFHGPTLNYFTLAAPLLTGSSFDQLNEAHLRGVTVAFGLLAILLCALLRDGLGGWGSLGAALLVATAPAFVFYSRYYIQETLLTTFTLAAIGCGWRYAVARRWGWAAGCGAALGLMHATKETCVLSFAALGLALLIATRGRLRLRQHAPAIGICLAAAVVVSVLFFSSFGSNWHGVIDSVGMLSVYSQRAGGADQPQPWWFFLPYLSAWQARGGPLFVFALIPLLALCGAICSRVGAVETKSSEEGDGPEVHAFRGMGSTDGSEAHAPQVFSVALRRFLTVFTLSLLLIYSAIPYKTPWCILQPLLGLALLAGFGVQSGFGRGAAVSWRLMVGLLLAVGVLGAVQQSNLVCTRLAADQRNPFVYSHPLRDAVALCERIERLAKCLPAGRAEPLHAYVANPWPLPWYLRRYPNVGWWEQLPPDAAPLDAAVIVADHALQNALTPRLQAEYVVDFYGLRPGETLALLVRRDVAECFRRSLVSEGTMLTRITAKACHPGHPGQPGHPGHPGQPGQPGEAAP